MLPRCPLVSDEKGDAEPPSACESSGAKRVMVMLPRDCGWGRAVSELVWKVCSDDGARGLCDEETKLGELNEHEGHARLEEEGRRM